jgi:hypothetical protein
MLARTCAFLLLTIALACSSLLQAQTSPTTPTRSVSEATPTRRASEGVARELFDAIDAGLIDAKLILRDETAGRVLITNKTKQPLTIRLPEAFAGVPALAQFNLPGLNPGLNGNNNPNNGGVNQGVGAGQGNWNNNGLFSIEPEKAIKVKIVAVCLEHGKREPNVHVAYRLLPLDDFTSDAKVIDVVGKLGRGELDQKSAQAAAWHLADGLSWKQLAAKVGVRHIGGRTEPFFTAAHLERAKSAVAAATSRGEQSASLTR